MKFALSTIICSIVLNFFIFYDTALIQNNGPHASLDGDVIAHAWIIERAEQKENYTQFITQCEWSNQGCFRYDSVPYEWPILYSIGKFGKSVGLNTFQSINAWYLFSYFINFVFIVFALFIFTQRKWESLIFALPVAYQFSINQQVVMGHLVLTLIGPALLSLSLVYYLLTKFSSIPLNRKVTISVSLFILTLTSLFTSYTYSFFSVLLHLFAIFLFFAFNKFQHFKIKLITISPYILAPTILAALIWIPYNLHIFRGANGIFDKEVHVRSPIGISIFSARPSDFLNPPPHTLLRTVMNKFGSHYVPSINRGEVFAYQGTFIILSIIFFIVLYLFFHRFKIKDLKGSLKRNTKASFFLAMSFLALLFTLRNGGYAIYYLLTKSFRAYNRMAPFAAFFLVCTITWSSQHYLTKQKSRLIFLGLFLIISFLEIYQLEAIQKMRNYISSGAQMRQMNHILSISSKLDENCGNGYIELQPAFQQNFKGSTWASQYLLEKSHCKAIGGSFQVEFPHQNHLETLHPSGILYKNGATFGSIEEVSYQ